MAVRLESLRLQVTLGAELRNLVAGQESPIRGPVDGGWKPASKLTSGISEFQADRLVQTPELSIASGGTLDVDLFDLGTLDVGAGAGRDAIGQLWSVAKLVALLVQVSSDSAGTIAVGGNGTSAAWTSGFGGSNSAKAGPLDAGAVLCMISPKAGWAIADGTNHLLRLTAAGGTAKGRVTLLARSA